MVVPSHLTFTFSRSKLKSFPFYEKLDAKSKKQFEKDVQDRHLRELNKIFKQSPSSYSGFNVGVLKTADKGDFFFSLGPIIKNSKDMRNFLNIEYGTLDGRELPKKFVMKIMNALNKSSFSIIEQTKFDWEKDKKKRK